MGDLLGNLVFVVVAILAWIVKETVERKEAREKGGGTAPSRGAPTAEPGPREVDVVYGRRKIPDALTASPPLSAEAAPAARVPSASAGKGKARAKRSEPQHHVPGSSAPEVFDALVGRGLTTELLVSAEGRQSPSRRARADGWRRLGVGSGAARLAAVRAGVLWSEVLATPRALSGPHRSPLQRRQARNK